MSTSGLELPPQISIVHDVVTWTLSEGAHVYVPSDPTARQRMRLVEISGTLSFWDRPEEDIYTLGDGEPA